MDAQMNHRTRKLFYPNKSHSAEKQQQTITTSDGNVLFKSGIMAMSRSDKLRKSMGTKGSESGVTSRLMARKEPY